MTFKDIGESLGAGWIVHAWIAVPRKRWRDEHDDGDREKGVFHAISRRDASPMYSRSRYSNQSKSAGIAVPARS